MKDEEPRGPRPAPLVFEAVLFDCDGVLVDSEPIANRVLTEMLQGLGLSLSQTEVEARFMGQPLKQSIELIETLLGHGLPLDWYPGYQQARDLALRAELQAVPGVEGVLRHLQARGCKVAVASGAEREKVALNLSLTKLARYFGDQVCSGSDVARSKPAPDVYLLAASRLGVAPARCAVIEDTPTGTLAGIAAGMTVLGYCRHSPAAGLLSAGAAQVFDDMGQLSELLGWR